MGKTDGTRKELEGRCRPGGRVSPSWWSLSWWGLQWQGWRLRWRGEKRVQMFIQGEEGFFLLCVLQNGLQSGPLVSATGPWRVCLTTTRTWPPCLMWIIQTFIWGGGAGWKLLQLKARCIQSDLGSWVYQGWHYSLPTLSENHKYLGGPVNPKCGSFCFTECSEARLLLLIIILLNCRGIKFVKIL